ncbi:MAG: DUF1592 domain-containing protein [Vicinamibacterales bacterium]
MKRTTSTLAGIATLGVVLAVSIGLAQRAPVGSTSPAGQPASKTVPRPAAAATPKVVHASTPASPDVNALVGRYCRGCHNEKRQSGNLSLEAFDIAQLSSHAETGERMIRKMQAGMMPPPGAPRPDPETYAATIRTLETTIDTAAARMPNPGGRTFQRLNRAEYERAIRDVLGLEVSAGNWLPLDQMSANFDNIADVQAMSPTLLEGYLNAASDISRMAIGDRRAPSVDITYTNSSYLSQHPWDHVDGAPYGTRGGMVVNHVFPADAEYVFEMTFNSGANARFEDVDLSVDGERVALVRYETGEFGGADGRGGASLRTDPITVRAGQHRVSAAFVRRLEGPYEDLIRPHDWSYAGGGSGGPGITTLPHLRDLIVSGPFNATGISDSTSRQKVFVCRPTISAEERPCARRILAAVGAEAYRRPLSSGEIDRLVPFFEGGATKGGFELGVRSALEAILASPHFVFRLERVPDELEPGRTYRITDLDLASRLSFFLWGTPPDDDLQQAASRGELSKPGGLDRQAKRMLADHRADALGTRFAAQWLRLQDIDKVHPDPNFYPNFDDNLAHAMRRETETFFADLVHQDRSLLDLFTADYTFVNERLARHYGIPNVTGPEFRRVTYPDAQRRGILGQGSVLVLTSLANRTSPVLRGKWVMEVLLGTPPPPPPPNVPTLEETEGAKDGRLLTTRERMEMHRANVTCSACHRFMDPIGLALDAFDVTGKWRVRENGAPLDTRGDFYDGTPVSTPGELSAALLKRPQPLVRNFTENLLAYALGRRAEYFDQPTIRAIVKKAEASQFKMSAFILGVIKSDAFQMKRVEPMSTEDHQQAARP